ncbi:MAG: hypothetical protein ACYTG0_10390, partial [Planctomycetota bacterium]
MKTARVVFVSAVVLAVAGSILATRGLSSAEKRRVPQAASAGPSSTEVSTATLPKGLATLRVDFRSKGERQAKEPTVWDGQV